ncbi:hypothetical protein BV133_2575 [Blastochloris viridis]|uniref:Uncharacterized protein n=1 Tax=Blastochloris viridis TaxID=1079 RepID=A0A182D485_BLAVI|nr:hypothetical protein BV133_2575 [Blastochloris viridis]
MHHNGGECHGPSSGSCSWRRLSRALAVSSQSPPNGAVFTPRRRACPHIIEYSIATSTFCRRHDTAIRRRSRTRSPEQKPCALRSTAPRRPTSKAGRPRRRPGAVVPDKRASRAIGAMIREARRCPHRPSLCGIARGN